MQRRTFLNRMGIAAIGFTGLALTSSSSAHGQGVDVETQIDSRFQQLQEWTQTNLDGNAQVLGISQSAKSAALSSDFQLFRQNFNIMSILSFSLGKQGALSEFQQEQFQLILTLIADAVRLSAPQDHNMAHISVGLYEQTGNSDGSESVVGPFFGDSPPSLDVTINGTPQTYKLVNSFTPDGGVTS